MDAKQYDTLSAILDRYNLHSTLEPPEALQVATIVLNDAVACVQGQTVDAAINRGILHHAMRQIDLIHNQAVTIRNSRL